MKEFLNSQTSQIQTLWKLLKNAKFASNYLQLMITCKVTIKGDILTIIQVKLDLKKTRILGKKWEK